MADILIQIAVDFDGNVMVDTPHGHERNISGHVLLESLAHIVAAAVATMSMTVSSAGKDGEAAGEAVMFRARQLIKEKKFKAGDGIIEVGT